MPGFKEILKHSGNYLIANLATKALAFISIPIYTRLLSTEEYGVLSIFLGAVGIFGSILTLCTDQSISRYYFDQKDEEDFRRFTGTSTILGFLIFCFNALVLVFFASDLSKLIGLSNTLFYFVIIFAFFNSVSLTFEQIYGPLKKSKLIAMSALSRAYISFGLSVGIIFLLKSDHYYGPIIGQIIGGSILVFFWVKWIKPYFKFSFDKAYISYIFSYSVPLIPYVLSGVIIEQFGKIAIGNTQGASQAGFYSLALAISSIVNIVIAVSHQAWNPYYFEYMNAKNYAQHDKDQNKIFRITILVAISVACFGSEIGTLLAKKSFSSSLYLVPIFVLGYVFYQLAYVYMRNFSFTRKTQYLTFSVLISGISNVILNTFLIPWKGELGAAISFVCSYVIMSFCAWCFNKFLVKHYGTPLKVFVIPLIISIPFFISVFLIPKIDIYAVEFVAKLLIIIILGIILFWNTRSEIFMFLKSKINTNATN